MKVAAETKIYKKIRTLTNFMDEQGVDIMDREIQKNYDQIKSDVKLIVEEKLERIKSDDKLEHLIKENTD